jgi:two-component system, chemotaxis family, chemotaxis protein CheY
MKMLIAEDDFTSRRILQKLLSSYGVCDVATDGKEAIEAFELAWAEGEPYDLICLDIMMPHIDGQQVLETIRSFEKEKSTGFTRGVKIIMTTALDDYNNIMKAFKGQCDAYLAKPIEKAKLVQEIEKLGLL